jgi:hypothetical protein
LGALNAFLDIERLPLNHVKGHVAAWRDEEVAIACAEAAHALGMPMYGTTETFHKTVRPRSTHGRWEISANLDYDDPCRCIIRAST